MTKEKVDFKQEFTDNIVAAIESGKMGKYQRPWTLMATPINAITRKPYRGCNILNLMAASVIKGYSSNEWATFKAFQELGGCVKKGEKSTHVVFWNFGEDKKNPDEKPKKFAYAKVFSVFNAEQVENYTPKPMATLGENERSSSADAFFGAIKADVSFGGDVASYSPSLDKISMPTFDQFVSGESYYSVLAHEFSHWTGSQSRLDRKLSTKFGSADYAFEELIAELSSAFTLGTLGLCSSPREDHAPYVASWLLVLKNNKNAIYDAAKFAQAATDYLVAKAGGDSEKEVESEEVEVDA